MTEVAEWIEVLGSGDVQDRRTAAEELMLLAEDAQSAAIALLEAVVDHDEDVRNYASEALENLGPPPGEALGDLRGRLDSDHADIAWWAATLLGRLGASSAPAAAKLADVVAEEKQSYEVRRRCTWALGRIGPAAADSSAILHQLAEGDTDLADEARRALARIVDG